MEEWPPPDDPGGIDAPEPGAPELDRAGLLPAVRGRDRGVRLRWEAPHLTVVALGVAAALALTCWTVVRSSARHAPTEQAAPPVIGTAAPLVTAPEAPAATGTGLVDLNSADAAALDTLPGIGPVTAAAIIDWRTRHQRFASVDELLEVDGIGPAKLAKVRDHVTV